MEQFRTLFSSRTEVSDCDFKSNGGDLDFTNNSDNDDISHSSNSTSNTVNDISGKPVVLNKSSFVSGTLDGGENPFGSTFCYGTDQIIVEVKKIYCNI